MNTSLAGSNTSISSNLDDILNRAIETLDRLGSGFAAYPEKLKTLKARLAEGRFHLAVLGQFKRGKSTLLNAFIGEPVLPTAVVPLTAIPTFIRYDHSKHVRISFLNQQPVQECFSENPQELNTFLAKYVSEEENSQNRLGVAFTELFTPADILKQEVVLIDTPGIGSTHRHNTETTLNFLQQCDAALFLLSADPPITEAELDFLREALPKIKKIFMALNKIDYLQEAEKDALVNFLRKVLTEKLDTSSDLSIHTISARQGLEAKLSGDPKLWEDSGLKELSDHLINFLTAEKNVILKAAVTAKTSALLAESAMQIELSIQSLELPLNRLEKRLEIFEGKIKEAETERQFARDILTGDRTRLLELLEEQAQNLRLKSQAHFEEILQQSANNLGHINENEIRQALSSSIPAFFEHELTAMSHLFDSRVFGLLQFHQNKADDLIEAVRSAAAEIFEIPYHSGEQTRYFESNREPYWVTHQWDDSLSPIPVEWIDCILPRRVRENRIRKRLLHLIHLLIQRNVENLRWATLQNLDNTFRRFTVEFDQRLQETINATQGAIKATILKRSERGDEIFSEVQFLKKTAAEICNLQKLLG